jgi:uroporphyrinogen decarboxylase
LTKREHIRAIISGAEVDHCGLWIGNPHPDSWPALLRCTNATSEETFRQKLGDEFRWICPQFFDDVYQDPSGAELFDEGLDRKKHARLPLADCESVEEVEAFAWPNPDYLNFDSCLETLRNAGDVYRASGFWTCFYHNLMDLFGMEEYLIKMYTHPEVVLAATDKVCQFYHQANERFFTEAGDLVDGFFFGNDFGTQTDLICSPELFHRFIMPWFRTFTAQAHDHGYQAILHSCGAIHKVITDLIDAGVDCLHPLQALANDMDAETLARDFKGKIAFMGGIDTQNLLVNASPDEIEKEVCRVRKLLGPNLIVSPSHECLLPNIPPSNVLAMVSAALK